MQDPPSTSITLCQQMDCRLSDSFLPSRRRRMNILLITLSEGESRTGRATPHPGLAEPPSAKSTTSQKTSCPRLQWQRVFETGPSSCDGLSFMAVCKYPSHLCPSLRYFFVSHGIAIASIVFRSCVQEMGLLLHELNTDASTAAMVILPVIAAPSHRSLLPHGGAEGIDVVVLDELSLA